jgi:hypothetical protein
MYLILVALLVFFEAAKRRGWNAYGVEISAYSAEIAQERFGTDKVFKGLLKEATYNNVFFMRYLCQIC